MQLKYVCGLRMGLFQKIYQCVLAFKVMQKTYISSSNTVLASKEYHVHSSYNIAHFVMFYINIQAKKYKGYHT